MKTFIAALIAVACLASMTACSSRRNEDTTSSSSSSSMSSSLPSSSMPSSSMPASSDGGLMSDVESGMSDMTSKVESIVAPAMSADFDKIGALGAAQIKWGPGNYRDPETNRTTDSDSHQQTYGKYGAYFIAPADCGKFYLTFDEGYENGYSAQILDVLKEKDAQAVFFVTLPYVKSCPELVQRMIDEGHIVGNHTSHHWNPTEKTPEQAQQDIAELHEYMLENFNYTMSLYRPPEGAFSEQTLLMAQQMGYTTLLWSFAYADWDPNKQPDYDTAFKRTTDYIHEGGLYLLHAVSKTNTAILGPLIDQIRAQNLEISLFDLPYIPPAADANATVGQTEASAAPRETEREITEKED